MPSWSFEESAHKVTMQLEALQAMSELEKIAFRQLLISLQAYQLTSYAEKEYIVQYENLINNLISYYRMRGERDGERKESMGPTLLPKHLTE